MLPNSDEITRRTQNSGDGHIEETGFLEFQGKVVGQVSPSRHSHRSPKKESEERKQKRGGGGGELG